MLNENGKESSPESGIHCVTTSIKLHKQTRNFGKKPISFNLLHKRFSSECAWGARNKIGDNGVGHMRNATKNTMHLDPKVGQE